MNRRGFLHGILALGMAPAIIKAEILMPVRKLIVPAHIASGNQLLSIDMITREALQIFHKNANVCNGINRQYDDSFARCEGKIGNTLRIRLPSRLSS